MSRSTLRRRTPTSSPLGLILGLAGGSLLVILLAIGVTVFVVVKGLRDRANAARPNGGVVPVGGVGGMPVVAGPAATTAQASWANYRHPEGWYSVKLPMSSPYMEPPPAMTKSQAFGADKKSTLIAHNGKVNCGIVVHQLSADSLARHQEMDRLLGAKMFAQDAVRRQVNWGGRVAIEDFDPKDTSGKTRRTFLDGNRLFEFTVSGFLRPLADEDRAMFFDSVVFYPPN
jgi:hypothetical protein